MSNPVRGQQRLEQRLPPRRKFNSLNRFDYDETKRPAGMAYQWFAASVGGMENHERLIMAEQNGWTPVPADRHPELMGARSPAGADIVRGGQILMEIPQQYQDEDREEDKFAARHAVESQVVRLGLQARQNGGRGIKRSIEPVMGEEIEQ